MTLYKDPKVWGAPAWMFLHCVTLTYPESPSTTDKKHYKKFFESLEHVLPCKKCREHYGQYLLDHPLDPSLVSQKELVKYMIRLHNYINVHYRNKPKISLSEAKKEISMQCQKQQSK